MSRRREIDRGTLSWVRKELDATLQQSVEALEHYADDPDDLTQLQFCNAHLHQVYGILQMLELSGAAMLAEEMEALGTALLEGRAPAREPACEALMSAVLRLRDYLQRTEVEEDDAPLLILPLVNELRAAGGGVLITESVVFRPDLSGVAVSGDAPGSDDEACVAALRRAVPEYQRGLLGLIRGHRREACLARMSAAVETLESVSPDGASRAGWVIAAGFLGALSDAALESHEVATRALCAQVEQHLRRCNRAGTLWPMPEDTLRGMLYYVARSSSDEARVAEIQQRYRLAELLAEERAIESSRDGLFGPGSDAFSGVAVALREELAGIKDTLDLHARGGAGGGASLGGAAEVMRRVADTLGVIGLATPRRLMLEQAELLPGLETGEDQLAVDKVAETLLYVESSLDELVSGRGRAGGEGDEPTPEAALFETEFRTVYASAIDEAIAEVGHIKEAIIRFLESHDKDGLNAVPERFVAVRGALDVIELERASRLTHHAGDYVARELLDGERLPSAEALDDLADAVTSIEYYLEAVRDGRSGAAHVLDVAANSLERLVRKPVGGDNPAEEAGSDADASTDESGADDTAAVPPSPGGETPAPAAEYARRRGRVDIAVPMRGDDDDPEILEIFIEEADEVLDTLRVTVPRWAGNPEDMDALVTTRRMFHTLKGSGRLAGALLLGELAWSVENLLNRLLDRTLDSDPAIPALVTESLDIIPGLVEELRGGEGPESRARNLMRRAVKLAGTEVVEPSMTEAPAPPSATESADKAVEAGAAESGETRVPEDDGQVSAHAGEEFALDPAVDGSAAVGEQDDDDPVDGESHAADASRSPADDGPDDAVSTPAVDDGASGAAAEPAMDPVLYDIFSRETGDHLAEIERFLAECEDTAGACRVDEDLVRSLHTLTGSARMANVTPIAQLGRAMEDLARARQAAGRTLSGTEQQALRSGVEAVRSVVEALGPDGVVVPSVEGAVNDITALGAEPVGPSLEILAWPDAEQDSDDVGASSSHAPGDPDPEPDPDGPGGGAPAPEDAPSDSASPDPDWESHPAGRGEVGGAAIPRDEPGGSAGLAGGDPEYPVASTDGVVAAWPEPDGPDGPDGPDEPDAGSAGEAVIAPLPAALDKSQGDPISAAPDLGGGDDDEDLAVVFIEEAEELIDFLDDTLSRWEDAQGEEGHLAEMQRALHTLKGGARLAGFEGMGRLCHQVESLANDVGDNRVPADDTLFELFRDAVQGFQDLLERAREGVAGEPPRRLLERIEELRQQSGQDAAGDHAEEEAPDQELVEVFLEEATEILSSAEKLLHGWREAPEDIRYVDEIQRALHTLKGGARMAGYRPIADLSHALETALRRVGRGDAPVSMALFDVLDAVNDRLIALRDLAEAGDPLPRADDLIDALERVKHGDHGGIAAPAVAPERAAEPADTGPATAAAAEPGDDERRQSDAVRVRAELLDNLVNYAGEVSIYRSRLEQQSGAVSFNLGELQQTVERLRDQLRTLEIETEAQMLYRFEREQDAAAPDTYSKDFDPLEMDRFSRMQELSRALSESANDLSSIQGSLENLNRETETLLLQQSRVNTDLQDGLMRTRMVPFASLVPRMRRIVRQAGRELGKKVALKVVGAQGEMDRSVLERVIPPLEHMLRNAVAHGIEAPEQRRLADKPESGTISVSLAREGADVIIRVSDDGSGMDLDAIRRNAVDRGLMAAGAPLTDKEVMQFVMEAGFSTAEQVTQLAGRGVGMDVVNADIKQLGGTLDIDSEAGNGTLFTVRLPFTLALNQALLCRAADEVYAIPLSSIEGVVRIDADELSWMLSSDDDPVYHYAGMTYSLRTLSAILGAGEVQPGGAARRVPLVLVQAGDHRLALQVDGLLGSREIVVKSVGAQISAVPGVLGATILADGRVVLILDVGALVRYGVTAPVAVDTSGPEMALATASEGGHDAEDEGGGGRPIVMVVDDSITMRKVATRLLQRNSIDVVTAKDGVDAVARLQDTLPDAMLLDIEMPRMDGYELATHMRNDERLKRVPIVMITSRTGEKHRERALEIGVDRYLGKPYQEAELLSTLRELVSHGRAAN